MNVVDEIGRKGFDEMATREGEPRVSIYPKMEENENFYRTTNRKVDPAPLKVDPAKRAHKVESKRGEEAEDNSRANDSGGVIPGKGGIAGGTWKAR